MADSILCFIKLPAIRLLENPQMVETGQIFGANAAQTIKVSCLLGRRKHLVDYLHMAGYADHNIINSVSL